MKIKELITNGYVKRNYSVVIPVGDYRLFIDGEELIQFDITDRDDCYACFPEESNHTYSFKLEDDIEGLKVYRVTWEELV